MNAILEQINSAGYAFVEFALPMLVQSSVLIVIFLSLDFMLKKKVRAVFRYCIWMLVLVKLVLPSSLSSPVSFGYWLGVELPSIKVTDKSAAVSEVNISKMAEAASIEVSSEVPAVTAPMMDVEPAVVEAGNQPVVTSVAPVAWQGVVFLVWLAVVVAMGLLLLQRAIFVSGLVAQAKEPSSLMDDALKYCCRCIGIRGKVGLKVSANATSPAVCGLFRPVILVPENLGPSLAACGLRTVLLHELAHIKRGDLWVNLVQTVLQIIYFYNPLLWLANAMIRRVREQAVDETVQVAMGEKARQYPETLVNVAKLAFKRPALSLRLIGVVESKSALKGRVRHMLSRPIPKSAKLGILGLIVVLIVGAVLLPMAKAVVGPPELVIKGTVTDAETGEPIAGARVFDDGYGPEPDWTKIQRDKQSEWGAITNSAGKYSFLTWPEHHSIKVEAPAYKAKKESLYSGHFTLNKKDEEIFDFALEAEQSSDRTDYSSVTVTEGVGFDEIIVGDPRCNKEFIKSKFGRPEDDLKDSETDGWWISYRGKNGIDFWFDNSGILKEIRLNENFKGSLTSGISISSVKEDVFGIYGRPIAEETVDDLQKRLDGKIVYRSDRILYKGSQQFNKPEISKIYYHRHALLFWFVGDRITQIVIFPKKGKSDVDVEVESEEQSKTKDRVKSTKETKALIEQNLTNEAVYRQLEEVVELSGLNPDMAFAEAIEEIRYSVDPPLRIVVMWRNLFDDADIDQTTPINMDAIPAVRLVKGLKLLLESVSGGFAELGFVVEDGVITIATKESLPAGLETRVYDISKLVSTSDEANDFGLLIIHTIAPDSWHGAGGEGRMIPHQDKKLVVSQIYEVHREIQKLLADLRTSSAVQVEAEAASKVSEAGKMASEKLPFAPGKLFIAENYVEAAGIMTALKAGVALSSVRRPLAETKVSCERAKSYTEEDSKVGGTR